MDTMDTKYFKNKLLKKESELQSELARFKDEARVPGEVRDSADNSTVDEDTWISVEAAEAASQTLREVQDALKRIEDGSYGKCTACGRQIEAARLEALPWTQYCLTDQEKEDGRRSAPVGSSL
jgi:DnaK suppressor protein